MILYDYKIEIVRNRYLFNKKNFSFSYGEKCLKFEREFKNYIVLVA